MRAIIAARRALAPLLVVIAIGCGGSEDEGNTPAATAGASGVAGESGSAGETGTRVSVGPFQVVGGTLDSVGVAPAANGAAYRIEDATLLAYPTACGQQYCVTGGLRE